MGRSIPVVAFVGKSDSGKTTFVEKVIAELTARGYRVATVKHHVHDFDIDVPGKDSYRHAAAGSVVTMVSSPDKFAIIRKVDRERTLDEMAAEVGDGVDILVVEGFKRAATSRIEISRRERSTELISEPGEAIAVVSDYGAFLPDVPSFTLDDALGVTDLIEHDFLTKGEGAI